MNNNYTFRALSIVLALIIMLTLGACGSKLEGGSDSGQNELSIAISSHPSWPYNENWKLWQYFQEATGTSFKITTMPSAETPTKVSLMMASPETVPDMIHLWSKQLVDQYALQGAFVALSDNPDKLPSYNAFWDTFSEQERTDIMLQRTSGDGKVYSAPVYGTHTVTNLRTWIYRKDIFEKHALKAPETFGELYDVAKKLKVIYPDSYPLCFRVGMDAIDNMGPSWKNDFSFNIYYDFIEKKFKHGSLDPIVKDMVEYLLKMQQEGLVPPDYLTIKTKSWEELMSTDRGFISLDYMVRLDFFNVPNRQDNPDFTLAVMQPPRADVQSGQRRLKKTNIDASGFLICNTGNAERIDSAFKVLDWMYTDEGSDLLSWGKEGETYEVVDGKRRFILKDGETAMQAYGSATYGLYQRIAVDAYESTYTEEQVEQAHQVLNYLEPNTNPVYYIAFTNEEGAEVNRLKPDIDTYVTENLSKFLLGQQSLSEWDSFTQGLKEMGVERLLEIYSNAYARMITD